MVRVSCLLRLDPAARGDTSGAEPTKGKRWPTTEAAPRSSALKSGPADPAADGGGSRSPASFVRDTEVQREDRSGPGRPLPNRVGGGAGKRPFLPYLHGRSGPSAYLYRT